MLGFCGVVGVVCGGAEEIGCSAEVAFVMVFCLAILGTTRRPHRCNPTAWTSVCGWRLQRKISSHPQTGVTGPYTYGKSPRFIDHTATSNRFLCIKHKSSLNMVEAASYKAPTPKDHITYRDKAAPPADWSQFVQDSMILQQFYANVTTTFWRWCSKTAWSMSTVPAVICVAAPSSTVKGCTSVGGMSCGVVWSEPLASPAPDDKSPIGVPADFIFSNALLRLGAYPSVCPSFLRVLSIPPSEGTAARFAATDVFCYSSPSFTCSSVFSYSRPVCPVFHPRNTAEICDNKRIGVTGRSPLFFYESLTGRNSQILNRQSEQTIENLSETIHFMLLK